MCAYAYLKFENVTVSLRLLKEHIGDDDDDDDVCVRIGVLKEEYAKLFRGGSLI